jgi:HSP20 family protein
MANRSLEPFRPGNLRPMGDPFSSFRRRMDQLFDDFFAPMEPRNRGAFAGGAWPSVDVDETEKGYHVTAELPGLEQKDVDVQLSENTLTIKGEKREERNEGNGGRRYAERTYGRFERVIPFESEVDADKVQATFKNGVLTVDLPKNPKARDRARHIEVKAA